MGEGINHTPGPTRVQGLEVRYHRYSVFSGGAGYTDGNTKGYFRFPKTVKRWGLHPGEFLIIR